MTVIWTESAKVSYREILLYLKRRWTKTEYDNFKNRTTQLLKNVCVQPKAFSVYERNSNIRKAILLDVITLYYTQQDDKIYLLLFWDNRRNPKDLKL